MRKPVKPEPIPGALGLERSHFYRKMKSLGISPQEN